MLPPLAAVARPSTPPPTIAERTEGDNLTDEDRLDRTALRRTAAEAVATAAAAGHAMPAHEREDAATPASTSDAPHTHSDAAKRPRGPRGAQLDRNARKRNAKRARAEADGT